MFLVLLLIQTRWVASSRSTHINIHLTSRPIVHSSFFPSRLTSIPTNTEAKNPFCQITHTCPSRASWKTLIQTQTNMQQGFMFQLKTSIFLDEQQSHHLQLEIQIMFPFFPWFYISLSILASSTSSRSSHFKFNFNPSSPGSSTEPSILEHGLASNLSETSILTRGGKCKK